MRAPDIKRGQHVFFVEQNGLTGYTLHTIMYVNLFQGVECSSWLVLLL